MSTRINLFIAWISCSWLTIVQADLPAEPLNWEYLTGASIYSSPTLSSDGTVYVGSGDNKVYALNPDGTLKWSYETGDWVDAVPALSEDESVVYAASWDNHLYALDAETGAVNWSYETGNFIVSSPSIGSDGTIYFGSNDNFFYALNPDGTLQWEYFLEGAETAEIQGSSAIDENGYIYFGAKDGKLYALNPDGTLRWYYQVVADEGPNGEAGNGEVAITSSVAIDDEGNLYFGAASGSFYSLDPDAIDPDMFDPASLDPEVGLRWKHRLLDVSVDDESIDSSPVVGPNGNVFYATREGYLIALDSDGVELWSIYVGDVFYSAPVVDSGGIVYIPSFFGTVTNADTQESEPVSGITAVDQTGEILWEYSLIFGYIDSSLAMDESGILYLGASDGSIVAFDTGSGNTLAQSEWPKLRGNRESNGRYTLWTYEVDASVAVDGIGTVTGSGHYEIGTEISLEAVPSVGYAFTGWSGDLTSSENPLTLTVTEDLSVTASFGWAMPFWLTLSDLGGNWRSSDWLGILYLDETGWVYHESLGWLFLSGTSVSLWMWHPDQSGWYGTDSETYPFLYSDSDSIWIYYHEESGQFYHYGTIQDWLDHP